MDTITIDGMDEHEFRHGIEDMLRSDNAGQAIEKLRDLLKPYVGYGEILPPRFLDVTPDNVEISGWQRLSDRLLNHDRPGFTISAIGIVLSDARALGGPGPENGRLAPFVKTFYFSDDAYPFTDATRDDLLDGYTRDGFGWQGDYQATDATISIRGIDDLYGAVVELEDRLMGSANPSEDEIRAGTIGACFLAALIHQALREKIRKHGLPRPLCVLAACDGVYPFFDAPVSGQDEATVIASAEAPEGEECEDEGADAEWAESMQPAEPGFEPLAEGSLLDVAPRKHSKAMALTLDEEGSQDAARYAAMAAAKRMEAGGKRELIGLLSGVDHDPDAVFEPEQEHVGQDDDFETWDEDDLEAEASAAERLGFEDEEEVDEEIEFPSDLPDPLAAAAEADHVEPTPYVELATSNSFRAKIRPVAAEPAASDGDLVAKVLAWIRQTILRR